MIHSSMKSLPKKRDASMIRVTVTGEDRQQLERVRDTLAKDYEISKEKRAKTAEDQRFRTYLFLIPKAEKHR